MNIYRTLAIGAIIGLTGCPGQLATDDPCRWVASNTDHPLCPAWMGQDTHGGTDTTGMMDAGPIGMDATVPWSDVVVDAALIDVDAPHDAMTPDDAMTPGDAAWDADPDALSEGDITTEDAPTDALPWEDTLDVLVNPDSDASTD